MHQQLIIVFCIVPIVVDVVQIGSYQRNKFEKQIHISLVDTFIKQSDIGTIQVQVSNIPHDRPFKGPELACFLVQTNCNLQVHDIILALYLCQFTLTFAAQTH